MKRVQVAATLFVVTVAPLDDAGWAPSSEFSGKGEGEFTCDFFFPENLLIRENLQRNCALREILSTLVNDILNFLKY